jgi:hypothetical protein
MDIIIVQDDSGIGTEAHSRCERCGESEELRLTHGLKDSISLSALRVHLASGAHHGR